MRKLTLFLLTLVVASQISYGQGFFTKAITKIAKIMPMPAGVEQKTATLTDIVITGGIQSNLPTSELGTMSQAFFTGWKTGGDQVAFGFSKKNSFGFYKIDGSVTADGIPLEYVVAGTYSYISDANPSPRKIEITTTTGEKESFTIEPNKNKFKVISINGQKDKISLDLTKDVVVELEGKVIPENAILKVGLAINQVSIKSIYGICYIRSGLGSTITIPAAAFRNISVVPGGNALYNFKKSYLEIGIESIENATNVSGSITSIPYGTLYTDGKLVTVTTEPVLNNGLTIKGTENDMDYNFFKPNAFMSRPFEHIKKIGLISFSIRGTTYHESSETSTSSNTLNMGGISNTTTTTTTKITTLEFPDQPNEVWDALLEKLYPEFMAAVNAEFNAEVVSVDQITNIQSYKFVEAYSKDDVNNYVNFARSFRNTKVLSAFLPISEGYGAQGYNQKIMDEVGADALLTMTLDLTISQTKDKKVIMKPNFAFEIVGKSNAGKSNTKYCTGTIKSLTGATFTKENLPDQLERIVHKTTILDEFRKGLKELHQKEKENGDYETVWNLQK